VSERWATVPSYLNLERQNLRNHVRISLNIQEEIEGINSLTLTAFVSCFKLWVYDYHSLESYYSNPNFNFRMA